MRFLCLLLEYFEFEALLDTPVETRGQKSEVSRLQASLCELPASLKTTQDKTTRHVA